MKNKSKPTKKIDRKLRIYGTALISVFFLFSIFTILNVKFWPLNVNMWFQEKDTAEVAVIKNFHSNAKTDIDKACVNANPEFFDNSSVTCKNIGNSGEYLKDIYVKSNLTIYGYLQYEKSFTNTTGTHTYSVILVRYKFDSSSDMTDLFYVMNVKGKNVFSLVEPSKWTVNK